MRESLKSVRKSAIRLALYYSLVAGTIIAVGSPLFRVLSFEFASLIALFGSLPVMWFSARYVQDRKSEGELKVLIPIWLALVPAILLPVVVSLIFVRSCDLGCGLGYYAQIVLPSTLIGTLFGTFCGIATRTRKARIILVISVWLATFLFSLIPGYVSQRIFTYGWQYGYFPGLVWDEYIALGERYYESLVTYFILSLSAVLFASARIAIPPPGKRLWNKRAALILIVLLVLIRIIGGRPVIGGLSHNEVERRLSTEFRSGSITVHTAEFSAEERAVLQYSIGHYLKEIKSLYSSVDTSMELDVYLYANSDQLYKYVGTRRASIAKPWLGTLHIAKENLSSLKHELLHLLLKPYGNFPFYASWSTGLTEGAAVAAEDDYDGLRTVDDLSAWALRMNYASGVSSIMKFTGFAATASLASYVLTGSFSKYLLTTYGPDKYLSLYHSRDYEAIYGKTLEALDAEWKQATLAKSQAMSPSDSLIARFYFERSSIVNQACLRRIGRLLHEAREAYDAEHYAEAFELYKQVYTEDSSRLDALRGMVLAKLKHTQFQFTDEVAIIDASGIMTKPNGKVLLSSLHGDVRYLASGDRNMMKPHYDDAIQYAPNDARYVSAVGLRMLLEDSVFDVQKFLFFRYDLKLREPYSTQTYDNDGNTMRSAIPQALYEHAWESPMPDSVRVGYILLRTLFNEGRGEYSAAIHEWTALPAFVDPDKLSPTVRKAYDIMDKKVKLWMQALNLP